MIRAVANRPVEQFTTNAAAPDWQARSDNQIWYAPPNDQPLVDPDGNPVDPNQPARPNDDDQSAHGRTRRRRPRTRTASPTGSISNGWTALIDRPRQPDRSRRRRRATPEAAAGRMEVVSDERPSVRPACRRAFLLSEEEEKKREGFDGLSPNGSWIHPDCIQTRRVADAVQRGAFSA